MQIAEVWKPTKQATTISFDSYLVGKMAHCTSVLIVSELAVHCTTRRGHERVASACMELTLKPANRGCENRVA